MTHPYKTREGGATVTVFVPYDCQNNCPFCINKKEYADCSGFSLEKILASIQVMDGITPRCDFVFTGGEPLADLNALQQMLDAIPATHKIYINTTFPAQAHTSFKEMLAFTERNKDKITCMNISRHLQHYVERFLPYRIPIQFRYDYTETTPENLYEEEHDKILQDLKRLFTYKGLDGCRMRNGFHFEYKGLHMTYHKTLPYSTIEEKGPDGVTYDILYDILIKQNGEIHSDWTGVKMDVDAYRRVVFEPYDLKVLNGTIDF